MKDESNVFQFRAGMGSGYYRIQTHFFSSLITSLFTPTQIYHRILFLGSKLPNEKEGIKVSKKKQHGSSGTELRDLSTLN